MNGHKAIQAIANFDLDSETNIVDVQQIDGVIVVEVAGAAEAEAETITEVDGVTSKPIVHRKKR